MTTPQVPADRNTADRGTANPVPAAAVIDERNPDTELSNTERTPTVERPSTPERTSTGAAEHETVVYPTADRDAAAAESTADHRAVDARSGAALDEHAAPYGDAARRSVVARQREAFGGVKLGSALFGWLAATGTAAILTGTVAGISTVLGIDTSGRAAVLTGVSSEDVGWLAVVVLAVILLVSYWCGGYVAARMARFNGAVQGLAVWVWALVIAIVVSLVSVIIGSQVDVLSNANLYPRIRMSPEEFTVAGLGIAAIVLVASLAGAVLGGMAGTRYHRRVDRAGFVEER